MPERNRVTPLGDIEAFPLRGAWTGNRGVLHEGHEIVRFHASDLWITCALTFRDYGREQWLPRRWTHLFFHDEAVRSRPGTGRAASAAAPTTSPTATAGRGPGTDRAAT